jgi:hypothetical protein
MTLSPKMTAALELLSTRPGAEIDGRTFNALERRGLTRGSKFCAQLTDAGRLALAPEAPVEDLALTAAINIWDTGIQAWGSLRCAVNAHLDSLVETWRDEIGDAASYDAVYAAEDRILEAVRAILDQGIDPRIVGWARSPQGVPEYIRWTVPDLSVVRRPSQSEKSAG